MVKRIIVGVVLLCAMPLLANAYTYWFFNTQVKSSGGTITSRNMVGQKVTDGSIFHSYTTHAPLYVNVVAEPGYSIRNVKVNNVDKGEQGTSYNTVVQGMTDQSVTATFVPSLLHIKGVNFGGTVNPGGMQVLYGYRIPTPVTFRFTPPRGFQITNIANIPSDPKVTHSPFSPGKNEPVTVTFNTGFIITQNYDLVVESSDPTPAVQPMLPRTVAAGTAVRLAAYARNMPNATFTWSYVSGPANIESYSTADGRTSTFVAPGPQLELRDADTATASFTAPWVSGQYRFRVKVSSPGKHDLFSMACVTVADSSTVGANTQCQFCHAVNRVGRAELFSDWTASAHSFNNVVCETCHQGAASGDHPGTTNGNVCRNCHVGSDGNVANHPVAIVTATCTDCHDPHSTVGVVANIPAIHFNNVTTPGYPASYVTSRGDCADCHLSDAHNASLRSEWAQSAHAATEEKPWRQYDFKNMSGCVQCHSATGFIAYSSGRAASAWGSATDKGKEVLKCTACHSDLSSGRVRQVAPAQPFADDPYRNRDVGASNICMDCHSGTNNGSSIKGDDFNNLGFIPPHFLAAGGTLHGTAGYTFGKPYAFYSTNTHRLVGMNNQNGTGNSGPCIGCHMSTPQKHLMQPVKTDGNGKIVEVTSSVCVNCHGNFMGAAALDSIQVSYLNSLNVLKAMLADKGFVYSPEYPYFRNTEWGSDQWGMDMMGAAYNYKLLVSEPGAFAHNSRYARQLITDSIDVLYSGRITGTSIDAALDDLVWKGAISQSSADGVSAYLKGNCISCHGGTSTSRMPITSNAHEAHLVASYGPGSYLGGEVASCEVCHVYEAGSHGNGRVEVVEGSCSGCHPSSVPAWGGEYRLACNYCHSGTPSVLPNGAAAPDKPQFKGTGHGQYPSSGACVSCHDKDAPHISGSLGTYLRLTLPNDNTLCGSCHNDPAKVRVNSLNMVTHRGLSCNACHDAHGTGNRAMIRSSINGSPISYIHSETDLIDTENWLGLCQVCHGRTKYYRAGVPETNHPATGCLECHSHNAAAGAFKPSGGI